VHLWFIGFCKRCGCKSLVIDILREIPLTESSTPSAVANTEPTGLNLVFVPVQEFYFALTLSVRTLEEFGNPTLVAAVRAKLEQKFGQASTVAAGEQNNFNYVFQVLDYDNSPAPGLVISIADWQGKIRLGSDYGWVLDESRKSIRTDKFAQRTEFAEQLKTHLQTLLELPLT
jgi:hypothetical protein